MLLKEMVISGTKELYAKILTHLVEEDPMLILEAWDKVYPQTLPSTKEILKLVEENSTTAAVSIIPAIKWYRDTTNLSLKEAKHEVHKILLRNGYLYRNEQYYKQ